MSRITKRLGYLHRRHHQEEPIEFGGVLDDDVENTIHKQQEPLV